MFDLLVFLIFPLFATWLIYKLYVSIYFGSKGFVKIREKISKYTENCNDLNLHIENLKSSYEDVQRSDTGAGQLIDNSAFNMKRTHWKSREDSSRVHSCSSSVCKNASSQPFKYLCKYFNIKVSESSLSIFENNLNNFAAVEQGKLLLRDERDAIILSIKESIPGLIYKYEKKRLSTELGFQDIDLSELYFPVYSFQYISAGGNSSMRFDIKMDINNLENFVKYLGGLIKFRKSIAGQRALMTPALREKIKMRDNYSCRICGIRATQENRLLLEIDHILPLSKGGITSESNLQALCWKCNRTKGSKILPATDGEYI